MRIETWEQLKKHLNTLSEEEIKCCGKLTFAVEKEVTLLITTRVEVLIMEDGTLEIVKKKETKSDILIETAKAQGVELKEFKTSPVDNSDLVGMPKINNECPSKVYEYFLEGKDAKSDRRG